MNKLLLATLIFSLSLSSCSKNEIYELQAPVSDFQLDAQNSATVTTLQSTAIGVVNNSKNAVSYHWDFGDGRTSDLKEPLIFYYKRGEYVISLKATTKETSSTFSEKKIKVLSPAIRTIKLTGLDNLKNNSSGNYLAGGEVWVEIYKNPKLNAGLILPDGARSEPLQYKSSSFKSASLTDYAAIEIPVQEKVFLSGKLPQVEYEFYFKLFVKDANGVTTELYEAQPIDIAFGQLPADPKTRAFSWSGLTRSATITINGVYE